MSNKLELSLDPMQLFEMDLNVYWLDKNGVYLGCNKKVLDSFCIPENMVVGKNNQKLVQSKILHQALASHIDSSNKYILTSNKPLLNVPDPVVIHANGKPTHYITHRFPLFDKHKNISGILGISIDITEKTLITQSGLFGYAIMAAYSDQQHKYINEFLAHRPKQKSMADISPKEARCLYYLLKGKSAREIGEILHKSTRTIEGHLENAKQKLCCTTRSELFDRILNDIELIYLIRAKR